jgi:hypothetical protein
MAPAISLSPATLPKPRPAPKDAATPLNAWLNSFSELLSNGSSTPDDVASLFLPDSYWRDHLCLSWENRTVNKPFAIHNLLSSKQLQAITLSKSHQSPVFVAPVDFEGKVPAICAFVDIKTTVGHGKGVLKLLEDVDGDGKWKVYIIFTVLMGLNACPERVGKNRPHGVAHGANPHRRNWTERRAREKEFLDEQPVVLIVGAYGPCSCPRMSES